KRDAKSFSLKSLGVRAVAANGEFYLSLAVVGIRIMVERPRVSGPVVPDRRGPELSSFAARLALVNDPGGNLRSTRLVFVRHQLDRQTTARTLACKPKPERVAPPGARLLGIEPAEERAARAGGSCHCKRACSRKPIMQCFRRDGGRI